MAKLEIKNLEMEFDNVPALHNVSFEVYDGEFLSILGPSGCGKTTLLRILIGLLRPGGGTVYKDGKDITYAAPSSRGMGIVFQNYALFENMTALGNVEYAQRIRRENRGKAKRAAVRERAKEMLCKVGLKDHMDKYPSELSGGQQQRVAIARTLLMNPDVILFDEPMSALDVATRLALRAEIKRFQQELGITIIYITHDQEEAFAMSDRIMVMEESKIAQIGTPEEIINNPASDYIREFVVRNLQMKVSVVSRYLSICGEKA